MSLLTHAARLGRLGVVLQLREAVVAPVLAVIAALPPTAHVLVGIATQGRRLDVLVPEHPGAIAALGLPAATGARGIRLRVEGDVLALATIEQAESSPRAAVDALAPADARARWFDLVDQFCSIAGGRVVGQTRWIGGERTQLHVRYPDRDAATDRVLMIAIDQLGGELGVSDAQRRLWVRVHPALGAGKELGITTSCTTGVSSQLVVSYPVTMWETAMRLAQGLVLDDAEARQVPTQLGTLAGALDSDHLESVDLELGPHEPPGVMLWARLAPQG